MSSSGLISQPLELIHDILTYMHPLDIVHCRQVSKLMKEIIDSSLRLNLILDLFEEGLLFRPDYDQGGIQNESEYFARYKESLHQMKLHHVAFVPTNDTSNHVQQFSQNCIAFHNDADITFVDLRPPCSTHTLQNMYLHESTKELLFKPSEDVLICIEFSEEWNYIKINCRSISTGLPHPLAAKPFMTVDLPTVRALHATLINDRIVIIALTTSHYLIHFKWKTERQAMTTSIQLGASDERYEPVSSQISALTDDLMLLCNIYRGPSATPLVIYSISQQTIMCRLHLPITNLYNIEMFSSPLVDDRPRPSSLSFRYQRDVDLDVIVIEIENKYSTIMAAISKAGILKLAAEASNISGSTELDWNEWGNGISAWLEDGTLPGHPTTGHMVCLMSEFEMILQEGIHKRKLLLDFNPRSVRRRTSSFDQVSTPKTSYVRTPVSRSTKLPAGQLSYRSFENGDEINSSDFILGGDFIVDMKPDGYDVFSLFPDT